MTKMIIENVFASLILRFGWKCKTQENITLADKSVLQYSKNTQRVKWQFTYPVLSQHKSESIGVFQPTSIEVNRSIVSILNNLHVYADESVSSNV